jgi:putative tricarboxylic transport membrane protein
LSAPARSWPELVLALAVLAIAGLLGAGALTIPSAAGYGGVGPNFLPWLVAAALLVCGVLLLTQALSGGFREREAPSGAARGDWRAFAWVSGGVLCCAASITRAGFVPACALCFVLAVRGLRLAEGRPGGDARTTLVDALTGAAIAWPVYLLFTRLLGISLPRLTESGWV